MSLGTASFLIGGHVGPLRLIDVKVGVLIIVCFLCSEGHLIRRLFGENTSERVANIQRWTVSEHEEWFFII